ncbi:hypothetical protein [Gemmata sp.]|uniref:hypothetical protein n=1 Tax=Gemmata sp. TaxID=1914242 RepID=UPI003F712D22
MATFYLLPPRACLEQALSDALGRLLPGLPLPAETWDAVTDRVGAAASWPADVFLVPRDDLPDGEPVGEALGAAFGAEPGDRVVEVSLARGPAAARSWVLGPADVSGLSAAR